MKEKNFKDLVTYFTMKEKEYLMIDNYLLDLALVNIEEVIDIEKLDDTKIFIETDDKLKDDVALKNVVILITWVIIDDSECWPQTFLEEVLYVK